MWKHVRAIVVLPGVVTVVVPSILLYLTCGDTWGIGDRAPWARMVLGAVGAVFAGAGLLLFVATNRMFAAIGRGTLAPWDPTNRLVVEGVYRRVRNPMISGVAAVLLGESLMAASGPLAAWFALFVAVNAVYIPFFEEPGLLKRFGAEYEEYRRCVPRWIPRLTPWIRQPKGETPENRSP